MNYLKIENLTFEEKLGLVLCARKWDTQEDIDFALELIKKHALGSVQIPFNESTPKLISKIKAVADYPIIIVNDMEKGYPPSPLPNISPLTLAACATEEHYKAFAKGVAKYAKADGFNGLWGPIVDILRESTPSGVSRCLGSNAQEVTAAAEIMAKVFMDNGFFVTAKHYPSGYELYDTHMTENICDFSKKELLENDIFPYVELNKKGLLPAVMTTHSIFTKIDPDYPATFSKKVLDILRDKGFNGVYFADSLAMMSILNKYDEATTYTLCMNAGIDVILPDYRTPTKDCYEMLKDAYKNGLLREKQLNNAVRRVLELQKWIGEHADIEPVLTDEEHDLLDSVTKDCITAVCKDGFKANLEDPTKRRLFVVVTPMDYDDDPNKMVVMDKGWYRPMAIAKHIKENFSNCEITFIPEFATAQRNEKLLIKTTEHDEVVFITYCEMSCYLGTDSLTKRTEALVNCVNKLGKVSAVVHFGNPYAVEPLNDIKRIIFGYNSVESQKYAIEVLAGKIPAKGKLPININLK